MGGRRRGLKQQKITMKKYIAPTSEAIAFDTENLCNVLTISNNTKITDESQIRSNQREFNNSG